MRRIVADRPLPQLVYQGLLMAAETSAECIDSDSCLDLFFFTMVRAAREAKMHSSSADPKNEISIDIRSERVKFGSDFLGFFSDRHVSTHAAFFIDYIKPGMSILDCGCGPGSITLDLAQLVSPGQAIGIDIENAQIERARMFQEARKVSNVEFRVADLNQLPFNDNTFDAVFAHGVIEYFRDPVHAFSEIRRVLKSNGVFGTRHADWGGFLLATKNAYTKRAFSIFKRLMRRNGGDPYFGRNQIAYLRRAGFSRMISSASYDCWTPTLEIARKVGRFMKSYFKSEEFVGPVLRHNLADSTTLEKIQSAFDNWGEDQDIFAAEAWGQAVAWKS